MTSDTVQNSPEAEPEMTDEIEHEDNHAESRNAVLGRVSTALTVAGDKGREIIADTREKSFRAAHETNRIFQEHPIAAVAAATAAGAILAIFLPKIAVASQAGAAASKVRSAAQQAARSKVAINAAQMVMATVTRQDKASIGRAVGKAAQAVSDRVQSRRSKKSSAE